MKHNTGFTLIELSIALVIIGLLVGGVLVGRDLIHAAEVRATVKQVEQLNAAVNTFNLKYNCLPGDCAKADQFGFTFTASGDSPNGNGNGKIEPWYQVDTDDGTNDVYEFAMALADMQTAGLIQGVAIANEFTRMPLKINGSGCNSVPGAAWGIFYMSGAAYNNNQAGHYFLAANSPNFISDCLATLWPADAFALDSKLDDGLPRSGTVLATGNAGFDGPNDAPYLDISDTGAAGASSQYCVTNATPPSYNVLNTGSADNLDSATGPLCVLTVKAAAF